MGLLADPADEHLDRVGVAIKILGIDVVDQLAARHHLAPVLHQVTQHPELVGGELDGGSFVPYLRRRHVEPYPANLEDGAGVARRPAHQRLYPCHQLGDLERLGEVVIGPGVEPLNLLVQLTAGGQHQHRGVHPLATPLLEHAQTIATRQAEIQNDGIIGLGLAEKTRLVAIVAEIGHKSGQAQLFRQLACQDLFIFNYQNSHKWVSKAELRLYRRRLGDESSGWGTSG